MNWLANLFAKPKNIKRFQRTRIEEIVINREYRIYSDDGSPDSCVLLTLEPLVDVAKRVRGEALSRPGNIQHFKQKYSQWWQITYWQIKTYECDRRLTLSRLSGKKLKVEWVIDFYCPNVPESRLLARVFKAIAQEVFVEEPDWYKHLLSLPWEQFFKTAVGAHDLIVVRPVLRAPTRKQQIDKGMKDYELSKPNSNGELLKARDFDSDSAVDKPLVRLPYEDIARLVIDQINNP